MSKYPFKVGDLIKDSQGRVGTFDYDDGMPVCVLITCASKYECPGKLRHMSASDWELARPEPVQPEPAQVVDWNYAEAQRLADAADAAIEAYNVYIQKQPKTVFIPKIK